jgi:hypothetical protein
MWVAASKFLHVFNPALFPIYDIAVVWNKVCNGVFRQDYLDFCHRRGYSPGERTAQFNLNYTLWASEYMQLADSDLMDNYVGWLARQVGGSRDAGNILGDARQYYAAAFEMIAIGAACLNGA